MNYLDSDSSEEEQDNENDEHDLNREEVCFDLSLFI